MVGADSLGNITRTMAGLFALLTIPSAALAESKFLSLN